MSVIVVTGSIKIYLVTFVFNCSLLWTVNRSSIKDFGIEFKSTYGLASHVNQGWKKLGFSEKVFRFLRF